MWGGLEVQCVWCVVYLLVLLWVSHFRCRVVGRVATLIRLLVTGVLLALRQWSGPVPREPCRPVAPGRVCAGLGAEDFQCGGILFAELCPCPLPVLWNYVLAMHVYPCSVLRLWSVLCLWWGGCLTVVRCRLCRRRLHVWCRLQWEGLSGHVLVAVLEGGDCARNIPGCGGCGKTAVVPPKGLEGGVGAGVGIRRRAGGPAVHLGACRCSRNSVCAFVAGQVRPVVARSDRGSSLRVCLC